MSAEIDGYRLDFFLVSFVFWGEGGGYVIVGGVLSRYLFLFYDFYACMKGVVFLGGGTAFAFAL